MGFVNEVSRFDYQQYHLRYEKAPNKQDFIPVNHIIPVYLQTRYEDSGENREKYQRNHRNQNLTDKQEEYSESREQLIAELSGKGQYFREYA